MSSKDTPDWIKKLHSPPRKHEGHSAEIDTRILQRLQVLSFDELNDLADKSGVRDSLGILMPPENWSREQYIEALSDTSEMTIPQINFIYTTLGIKE